MRYDAAIIGAGNDGLAAAIVLARAGLKPLVVERGPGPAAAHRLEEFHPGFRAAPFADSLSPVPAALFWSLGLARQGVIAAPPPLSVALWPDRQSLIGRGRGERACALLAESRARGEALLARAAADAEAVPPRFAMFGKPGNRSWPSEDWTQRSLGELLGAWIGDADLAAHLAASALAGRAGDPSHAGSALHLLAPGNGEVAIAGGPARLAEALAAIAAAEGVEIGYGIDVAEIRRKSDRVCGLALAGGTELAARAVISTLDLKQTFLSHFVWETLPPEIVSRAAGWRMGGGIARVLFALDAPPDLAPALARSPIHAAPSAQALADAHTACRAGLVPEAPPSVLRLVSACDPALAPVGQAVLTVTLGAIPFRLFDGGWTREKRDVLRDRARAATDLVLPGLSARVLGARVVAPPDFEESLGAASGDPWGGEIASDQMLGLRPGFSTPAPRTPMHGLYLAGPSTASGTIASCASGVFAARAVIADGKAGRLK